MSFSTPDLCDEHGIEQALELQLNSYGKREKFHGQIETVKCFEDNSLVKKRLAEPGEGKVLVVDGGASLRRALLGDMIAASAVKMGWAGLVFNGCIRDVEEVNALDIGVKALGTVPVKTDKRGEGQEDIPVRFGGLTFRPGDYLYSDANGIVVSEKPLL
jgi:regulator of ribonuclease activity A